MATRPKLSINLAKQPSNMTQEQLRQFIELYRELPCLWKVKSPDYCNKWKKERAYEQLMQLCKTFVPGATVDYVKSKIANLRTVFKKGEHKLEASKRSGINAEDVPKVWYHDLLSFVKDQDLPRESQSTLPTLPPASEREGSDEAEGSQEPSGSQELFDTPDLTNCLAAEGPSGSRPIPRRLLQGKKRKTPAANAANSTTTSPSSNVTQVLRDILSEREDECDTYAMNLASKMRRMTEEQRTAAEIVINEVVYKALAQRLNPQNPRELLRDFCWTPPNRYPPLQGPNHLPFSQPNTTPQHSSYGESR